MENIQEQIKELYLVSVSKTDEWELSGEYDGGDFEYEQGYQDALIDLHQKLFNTYLGDLVVSN